MSKLSRFVCGLAALLLSASVDSLLAPAHYARGFVHQSTPAVSNGICSRAAVPKVNDRFSKSLRLSASISTETFHVDEIPPLAKNPPLKVGLIVEPTPFTHVRSATEFTRCSIGCAIDDALNSGYSNRYKEMLHFLSKAGDSVEIVCPDDTENPPKNFLNYPISYTPGFRFSLYNAICLSYDHNLVGVNKIPMNSTRLAAK